MSDLIERLRFNADVLDRGGLHSGLAMTIREAAAALEAAREDAERYRWLRGSHWYVGPEPDGDTEGVSLCDRNDGTLDAAIDAAIDAAREARNG